MKVLRSQSAMLLSVLLAMPAAGQSTRPAATVAPNQADQAVEEQPLRLNDADNKSTTNRTSAASPTVSGVTDLTHIAVALLIVIGVILVLRSTVRHLTAMPGTARSGKMVTVLSRSVVSPRQQVLVLQVGKRLIVVGDSGGRMNPLCEISDPDEIAMLMGQTRDIAAERNPRSFLNLFRRANQPFSESDALAASESDSAKAIDPDQAVSSEEMSGLMEKVRMLQEQFKAKT